jgi:transcriptional regulator with XRE-family HTH domain
MSTATPTGCGQRVRKARQAAGLTLRELHELTKVSVTHLNDIELGHRLPSKSAVAAIAGALGLDRNVLLASMGRVNATVSAWLMANPEAGAAGLEQMCGSYTTVLGVEAS